MQTCGSTNQSLLIQAIRFLNPVSEFANDFFFVFPSKIAQASSVFLETSMLALLELPKIRFGLNQLKAEELNLFATCFLAQDHGRLLSASFVSIVSHGLLPVEEW
jgi:hypothetical protein